MTTRLFLIHRPPSRRRPSAGRTLAGLGPETGGLTEETVGSYLSGLTGELTGRALAAETP